LGAIGAVLRTAGGSSQAETGDNASSWTGCSCANKNTGNSKQANNVMGKAWRFIETASRRLVLAPPQAPAKRDTRRHHQDSLT